jgi:hypothetical protein
MHQRVELLFDPAAHVARSGFLIGKRAVASIDIQRFRKRKF